MLIKQGAFAGQTFVIVSIWDKRGGCGSASCVWTERLVGRVGQYAKRGRTSQHSSESPRSVPGIKSLRSVIPGIPYTAEDNTPT